MLREGYRIPVLSPPLLSAELIPMPSYNPSSTKGVALEEVTLSLIAKCAVELAPLPSLGSYSRLFVVWKTSGSWRPVIDLSALNRFVDVSHFQMETIQSVLLSIRPEDWMASIDLREAYLQVPVHPESRPFLRFVSNGRVYQFTALCFGFSVARSRIQALLTAGEFRSSASPPASVWLSLLGMLSSMAHLVPGGRLLMRSLQLCLH